MGSRNCRRSYLNASVTAKSAVPFFSFPAGPPPHVHFRFRLFRTAISRALSTIQKGSASSLHWRTASFPAVFGTPCGCITTTTTTATVANNNLCRPLPHKEFSHRAMSHPYFSGRALNPLSGRSWVRLPLGVWICFWINLDNYCFVIYICVLC